MGTTKQHRAWSAEHCSARRYSSAPQAERCSALRFYSARGQLVSAVCGVALTFLITAPAQTAQAESFQPLTTIAGLPRPSAHDEVHLINGEVLKGTVANSSLTLHTAYGSIPLNVEVIAGIELNLQPGNLDRISTVNRNRFTGFLNDEVEFRDATGETRKLNKASLNRIIFRQRASEAGHGVTRRFLVLNNGDLLSGQLLEWKLQVRPGAGATATGLDDLEQVRFSSGTREVNILMRNGSEQTGALPGDSLQFELDLGPKLQLPLAHLKSLYARNGSLPLVVRNEFAAEKASAGDPSSEAPLPAPAGLVWIRPGRFQLGSPAEEKDHGTDEDPTTEVVITRGFWMGQHEVTQAEYLALVGTNPSGFVQSTNQPVERVTWNEANAYCERLTARERDAGRLPLGYVYRLPTEAEWEYACRAGTTTRFSFGDDLGETELVGYAWFITNSESSSHPVGQLKPNPWGVHDLHGNVWEWCHDIWQDAYPGGTVTNYSGPKDGWLRVARGGSWLYDASFSRSANRDNYGPDNRCSDIGFRVVLGPPL